MFGIDFFQIGRAGLVHGQEWQSRSARLQTGDHAEMGVLLPFQFALLDRRPDDTQRSHTRIAHVGKDHLACASRRDHLVVDQVRCGACQGEIFLALPNDFMTRGKRDQMGESRCVDSITIVDILCNGFRE